MKKHVIKILTTVFTMLLIAMCATTDVKADDVLAFTKSINLGSTFEDSITTQGNGKYTFSISKSGTLTAQIGFYEGSAYSWGWHGTLILYDANDRKIKEVDVGDHSDGTDTGVFTADILAGDYYLYVKRPSSDKPSNYYITTSYIDSNETVVDSLTNTHNSQANPISLPLGKTYTGHIADNSTEDVYQVKSTKSQFLTFKVTNRTNGCVLKIINTNNTVNKSIDITQNAQSETVFCPKGTYYITISKYSDWSGNPHTGTYTIGATASKIPTTTIKKVTNKRGRIMAVKFGLKSTQTIKGYQIQYATNKKCTKGKKSFDVTNTDYLKSTYELVVKSKKTYYVRIRTYVTDNRGNRYYSAWSSPKAVKINK